MAPPCGSNRESLSRTLRQRSLRKVFLLSAFIAAVGSGFGLIRSPWMDVYTKAPSEIWTVTAETRSASTKYAAPNDTGAKAREATAVAVTTPTSVTNDDIRASEVVKKWGLIAEGAVALLERQYRRDFDYDAERDFVHFHHLHKTGGTSISDLMESIFGKNVLPGSLRSGRFKVSAVEDVQKQAWNYSVSFAHSSLRPTTGPDRTPLATLLQRILPHKRLRVTTMLRDPVNLRASNHAMWMCGLNALRRAHNNKRSELGLPPQCEDLNLTALIDLRQDQFLQKCADGTTKGGNKKNCEIIKQGIDPWLHCRSATALLGSDPYAKHFHNMYKIVMGRYTRNGIFTPMKGFFAHDSDGADEKSATVEEVERYTLEDLGGLDPNAETSGKEGTDFVWFGITERMFDSTCLFYYTFRQVHVDTSEEVPTARVMKCRPTAWWTEEDREKVKGMEPLDYAVFRAANAIMDVRLAKMRREIQDRLDGGATLESLPYVAPGCFNSTSSS